MATHHLEAAKHHVAQMQSQAKRSKFAAKASKKALGNAKKALSVSKKKLTDSKVKLKTNKLRVTTTHKKTKKAIAKEKTEESAMHREGRRVTALRGKVAKARRTAYSTKAKEQTRALLKQVAPKGRL